jgi:hypothetical protein
MMDAHHTINTITYYYYIIIYYYKYSINRRIMKFINTKTILMLHCINININRFATIKLIIVIAKINEISIKILQFRLSMVLLYPFYP